MEQEILYQVCTGATLRTVRQEGEENDAVNLEQLCKIGRRSEPTSIRASVGERSVRMEPNRVAEESLNQFTRKKEGRPGKVRFEEDGEDSSKCGYCGKQKHKSKHDCPAYGKFCDNCKKENHFASVCKSERKGDSKQMHGLYSDVASCGFSLNSIGIDGERENTLPRVIAKVSETLMEMGVDTQASICAIGEHAYNSMKAKPELVNSVNAVYTYGSKQALKCMGYFRGQIQVGLSKIEQDVYVFENTQSNLISYRASMQLGLIKLKLGRTCSDQPEEAFLSQRSTESTAAETRENKAEAAEIPQDKGAEDSDEFQVRRKLCGWSDT